jgi:hypothetical protein
MFELSHCPIDFLSKPLLHDRIFLAIFHFYKNPKKYLFLSMKILWKII